ncbi:MAG: (2Fe-2S)-binding protein [Pirellulales bacterium]|nr:(2Fe-2S)-binding protein [Planctomycetales bacterium]
MRLSLKSFPGQADTDAMVVISPEPGAFTADHSPHNAVLCPTDTVVCHCYGVRESEIRDAIDTLGASTVAEVTATTRAGGGCNGCHCRIRRMLAGKPAACSLFEVCGNCGFNTIDCQCHAA